MTLKEFNDYVRDEGFKYDYDKDKYYMDYENGVRLSLKYLELRNGSSIHATCSYGSCMYGCFSDTSAEEARAKALKGIEPEVKKGMKSQ